MRRHAGTSVVLQLYRDRSVNKNFTCIYEFRTDEDSALRVEIALDDINVLPVAYWISFSYNGSVVELVK